MYFKTKTYMDKDLLPWFFTIVFFFYFYVCIFLCEELTERETDYTDWKNEIF